MRGKSFRTSDRDGLVDVLALAAVALLACAIALRGSVAIITGGPGTGKTYTVARLLALLFATAPDAVWVDGGNGVSRSEIRFAIAS